MNHPFRAAFVAAVATAVLSLAGCSSSGSDNPVPPDPSSGTPSAAPSATPSAGEVVLVAYDSFALPKETLEAFTTETGLTVRVLTNGDTGELLNKAILTKDRPLGDALWGVDSTLLDRARVAEIFAPYRSVNHADLDPLLTGLAPDSLVTPVDYGDVCLNYDISALEKAGIPVPTSFEDLIKPEFKDLLVVENPVTSAPGLAFMLGTVAHFGTGGWEAYWEQLRRNGVKVVNGWTEAYEGEFTAGGGSGDRPLVVSYASSPPAAVLYGPDPDATTSPTSVVDATCFRVTEFAGVLAGANNPEGARKLVDFLTGTVVQNELPLNMFVFPANTRASLPKLFVDFAARPASPLTLAPAEIAKGREDWIDAWTNIMQ